MQLAVRKARVTQVRESDKSCAASCWQKHTITDLHSAALMTPDPETWSSIALRSAPRQEMTSEFRLKHLRINQHRSIDWLIKVSFKVCVTGPNRTTGPTTKSPNQRPETCFQIINSYDFSRGPLTSSDGAAQSNELIRSTKSRMNLRAAATKMSQLPAPGGGNEEPKLSRNSQTDSGSAALPSRPEGLARWRGLTRRSLRLHLIPFFREIDFFYC